MQAVIVSLQVLQQRIFIALGVMKPDKLSYPCPPRSCTAALEWCTKKDNAGHGTANIGKVGSMNRSAECLV